MSMTLSRTPTLHGIRPADRLKVAASALIAMARAVKNRRAARRIADLPDNLLNDIGLKRDDVHAALGASWREDPTYLLAVCTSRRPRRGR